MLLTYSMISRSAKPISEKARATIGTKNCFNRSTGTDAL